MSFDLQMLEQISLYLRGQIDVAELESRFAEITWDLDEEPPATRRVAFEALRLASETANGDWTDEVLREQLKRLLQTIPTSGTVSVAGEQFLERLSVAEAEARKLREGVRSEASMGYARSANPTEESYENWQSSDRAFLHQFEGESDTRHPAQAELAIG
jgi:hypothetical protein